MQKQPIYPGIFEKHLEDAIDVRVGEMVTKLPEEHVQAYYDYIDPEGHIKQIAGDEEINQLTLITDLATSARVVARAEITMEVRYTNADDLLEALKHAHDMRFGITDIELGEGRVH